MMDAKAETMRGESARRLHGSEAMLKSIALTISLLSIPMLACGGGNATEDDASQGPDTSQGPDEGDGKPGASETRGDISTQTDGEPRIEKFSTFSLPNGDFPTYLSHLVGLDETGHLFPAITISNPGSSKKTVVLRASLAGYSKPSEISLEIGPGERPLVAFDATLDYAALNGITTTVPAKFELSLSTPEGKVLFASSRSTHILPRNTVVWKNAIVGSRPSFSPFLGKAEMLAVASVMTTPHDAWGEIDELLHESAPFAKLQQMRGYEGYANRNNTFQQDADGAIDQVRAIYKALRARGFNYTSVTADFFGASSQHVRYPAESLRAKTGNCIDGSLVFSSALEAIGMRPFINFVPGHAFVGVYITRKGMPHERGYLLVETAMLGGHEFEAAANRGFEEDKEMMAAKTLFRAEITTGRGARWLPAPFPM